MNTKLDLTIKIHKLFNVMSYAGKWIRTESKINDTDLPRITQEYIKKNYPDATIKEAYMVQSDVLPGYKVILSKIRKMRFSI